MFYYGVKTSDLGSRDHVLKTLHGRMIFGPFEKYFPVGSLWRVPRAIIYFILTKQIFLHFYLRRDRFVTDIFIKQTKQSILMTVVPW